MKLSNFAVVSRRTSSEKDTIDDLDETLEFEFFRRGKVVRLFISDILN